MCELDLEPCEVWNQTERTARKPHRCDCCRRPIGQGQRYVNTFWKFEGEVGTAKACADCQVDIKAFAAAHGGSQFMPDYFVDVLKECIWDGDPESESVWKPMLERVRRPGVPRWRRPPAPHR